MSTPPSQPPGPNGPEHGQPQQAAPSRKRAWPRRHPIWSILITLFVLLVIIGAIGSATSPPSHKTSHTAVAPTPSSSSTPTVVASPLSCQVQASNRRPRDHATVKIRVSTVAHARVTATGPLALANGESAAGRASTEGTWTVRFRVGDATPGARVVITVRVSRRGSKDTCQTWLRPRRVKPAPPAAPPSSAPSPPSSAPSPPATAASCYPLSKEGTCYRPGEFCRDSDHGVTGVTGVAGDGEKIICEDNNGWRWEPA
jgi:hypothetical protein